MVSPCWSVDAFLSGIIVPSTHQVGGFFFSGHKVAMTVAKRESGEESRAFGVSYASTIFIVRSPRMRVVPNGTGVRLLLSRRVTMFSVVRIVTPLVEKASSTQGPVSVTPTRMWVRESERVGSGRATSRSPAAALLGSRPITRTASIFSRCPESTTSHAMGSSLAALAGEAAEC